MEINTKAVVDKGVRASLEYVHEVEYVVDLESIDSEVTFLS